MNKLEYYVREALKYEIFESVDDIAGDVFGIFTIANPFVKNSDFIRWKDSNTELPAWLRLCNNLKEFQGQAETLATIIEGLDHEGTLEKVRLEYTKRRARSASEA